MKYIILSADNAPSVYSVPDKLADNLEEYCLDFCCNYLKNSPSAKKYIKNGVFYYNEKDFIDYINTYIFSDTPAVFIKTLSNSNSIPNKYENLPSFNF